MRRCRAACGALHDGTLAIMVGGDAAARSSGRGRLLEAMGKSDHRRPGRSARAMRSRRSTTTSRRPAWRPPARRRSSPRDSASIRACWSTCSTSRPDEQFDRSEDEALHPVRQLRLRLLHGADGQGSAHRRRPRRASSTSMHDGARAAAELWAGGFGCARQERPTTPKSIASCPNEARRRMGGYRAWHGSSTPRGPDGADREIGDAQGHGEAPDRADARGEGEGRRARRLHRARADHLLPALADRGRGRARQLLRARDARAGDPAAVRRGEEARHRLLSRLRRTGRRRTAASAASTPRSWSIGPAAIIGKYRKVHLPGPCRAAARPRAPASREALFRAGQPRLPGVARLRRRHGHVHLQRPALARDLSRHGPAGRRDGHARLQHALRPHRPHGHRQPDAVPQPSVDAGRRLPELRPG